MFKINIRIRRIKNTEWNLKNRWINLSHSVDFLQKDQTVVKIQWYQLINNTKNLNTPLLNLYVQSIKTNKIIHIFFIF